ncbi:MAG: hypothetical protein GSR79_00440 [Desulfurococcales archaeon]|nr:hypothetical protein [Desulfurococcales archaeon]
MKINKNGIYSFKTPFITLLLVILYIIAFRNVVINVNESILLQGDDIGGFLRDIALLSKFWVTSPIKGHKDQIFPSIINLIGAIIFKLSNKILLAYTFESCILILIGAIGFNELTYILGINSEAKYLGLVTYIYNPAIASMFFTGELHIVSVYFAIPYILLLFIIPFKDKINYKYIVYSFIILLGLPYYHIGYLLQSLSIVIMFLIIFTLMDYHNYWNILKNNFSSIKSLFIVLLSVIPIIVSFSLLTQYIIMHNPFKLYITYSIYDFKKHSVRNFLEALTFRPLDLSYNYYFKQNFVYKISSYWTMISSMVTLVLGVIVSVNPKISSKHKKLIISTLFSLVISIIMGLGPNNPFPLVSNTFIYLFKNYHVINLLKMGYRFILIEAFFYAMLVSIVAHAVLILSTEKKINAHNIYIKSRSLVSFLLVIILIILTVGSSFLVSVQGFNKVLTVPNDWNKTLSYLPENGMNVIFTVPSFPYTTLLSNTPSTKDVGSLNYLATWLELHSKDIVYSNYYLDKFLQSLVLKSSKDLYARTLLNLSRNIHINYIYISKDLYPVTKVPGYRNEATAVYQYLQSIKLSDNDLKNKIVLFNNTGLMQIYNDHNIIYETNSFGLVYAMKSIELTAILNYFPSLPMTLVTDNINDKLIKNIFNIIGNRNYNLNTYLFISKEAIPMLILDATGGDFHRIDLSCSSKLLEDFYISFCRSKSFNLNISEMLASENLVNSNDKRVLLFIPIYLPLNGQVIVQYNSMKYIVNGSDDVKWLILNIKTSKLNNLLSINVSSSKSWFAVGTVYEIPYSILDKAYHRLSDLIKSHKLSPIILQTEPNNSVTNNVIILNDDNHISNLFINIENIIFKNKISILIMNNVILNNYVKLNRIINSGYMNIVSLQPIVNVSINIDMSVYKGNFIISLGDVYSIIFGRHNDQLIVTLRERMNDIWIRKSTCSPLVFNTTSKLLINYSYNNKTLNIKVNNRTCIEFNFKRNKEINNLYFGIYKGSLIDIRNFKIVLQGNEINIVNYSDINRSNIEMFTLKKYKNNINITSKPINIKSIRIPFSYFYTLRSRTNNLYVIYQPYTQAWRGNDCILVAGVFNSYIIALSNNRCMISYKGFTYIDTYIFIVLIEFIFLIIFYLINPRNIQE